MKKRIISILVICVLVAFLYPGPSRAVFDASDTDNALLAYYDFLCEKGTNVGYANVLDFDADGIPELVYMDLYSNNCIYTWNGSEMLLLTDRVHTRWKDFDSSFIITDGSDGKHYFSYSTWDDYESTARHVGEDYYYGKVGNTWREIACFRCEINYEFYFLGTFYNRLGTTYKIINYDESGEHSRIVNKNSYDQEQRLFESGNEEGFLKYDYLDYTQFNVYPLLNTITASLSNPRYLAHYQTASDWAKDGVNEAVQYGYVPYSLRKKYDWPITRSEFCDLAVQFYEVMTGETISERASFSDTQNENIEKMGGLGIISGYGKGRFGPNDLLTREQAAVILSNIAKKALQRPFSEGSLNFADKETISDWAKVQVGEVKAAGIMNGVDNNRFDPKGYYTREQSILTLLRLKNALYVPMQEVHLSADRNLIAVDDGLQLHINCVPEDSTNQNVFWTVTDDGYERLASKLIDEQNVFHPSSKGKYVITAKTADGCTDSIEIDVRWTVINFEAGTEVTLYDHNHPDRWIKLLIQGVEWDDTFDRLTVHAEYMDYSSESNKPEGGRGYHGEVNYTTIYSDVKLTFFTLDGEEIKSERIYTRQEVVDITSQREYITHTAGDSIEFIDSLRGNSYFHMSLPHGTYYMTITDMTVSEEN